MFAGNGSGEVANRAQQLLEQSLLSEMRACVARALSGLDMFSNKQRTELDRRSRKGEGRVGPSPLLHGRCRHKGVGLWVRV